MAFNLSALTAKQQAAAIYIGYYDRAPDPYGMDFWEAAVANPVVPLVDIATYFAAQEETYAVHPFFVEPSAAAANAFISELYLNLFNRTPDAAGLEFWSTVLQGSIAGTNAFSVGEIILEIIQGAQNTAAGQDITTLLNKIEVANAWTAGAIEAGLTEPNSYGDSEIAQNSAKSIINDVTSDASSVTAAEAVITTAFDGLFPGVAVDLTPNADIVELTRGSDTVTGVVLELSIGDTIIDPSTTDADVLNVELIEDVASNVTVQNIETVVLNALSGDRTIDVTNWDGIKTYQVVGEGDVTLVDVQTTGPSYEFAGTVGTNMTVSINDLATTGLADEISVKLSDGVAGGVFTLTPATTVETARIISNGTAENVITEVVGANIRTLIVEGDAAFENANAFASTITTIDARYVSTADIHSAGATTILTGAGNDLVTLDSALTNSSAIVMGAGTDRFDMMNSTGGAQAELLGMETIKTLDAADTNIDMAKATATPEFNIAGGSTSITLSNLINGSSVRTSDLSTSGNINIGYRNSATDAALVVDLGTQHNAADDAISFTNVSDVTLNVQNGLYAVGGGAAPTVTLDDTSLAAGVVSDVVKSVTINNIGVATNGTDDIVLGNVSASSRLETLNLNATGAAVTVGTLAEAEAFTNLNIDSTGGEVTMGAIGGGAASTGLSSINVTATEDVFLGAVAANNVGGVTDVTLAAANGDITGLVLTNDAGSIDTVTLSGGGAIAATFNTVLLGSGTAGYTKAINSTNTGSVNLTVSNAAASGAGTVVTLGDGSNTVTMLSSMNDVITGGAGSDTLVLGSGASSSRGSNTVDLGAGTDVLSFDVAGVAEANGIIINVGSSDAFLNGASGGTAASDELVATLTAYSRSNDDGNTAGAIATFTGVERYVGTDQADIMISGATGANMNGAAGDDSIIGGTGGDTITGGEGVDTITSGAGDDTINFTSTAADGNDSIDGGTGVDTLTVGTGTSVTVFNVDTLLQNVENISLNSGAGITLTGQTEAFTITGGGGAETITGGDNIDTINAGLGNDLVTGGAGADVINGQAGFDTVSYADVTLATSHGVPAATGMAINLSSAAITEATITAALAGAQLLGTAGATDLAAGTAEYVTLAENVLYVVDTISGVEGVVGSALNDYIALGIGNMSADGGTGDDFIVDGAQNDTIDGGAGADTITATTGDDVLTGGTGADSMSGGAGNDTFVADDADVLVDGGLGTDTMQLALNASFLAAELADVEAVTLASDAELTVDHTDVNNGTVTDQIATVTGVADGALEKLIITDAANTATTLNYSAANLTLNNVLLEVTGGTGANTIIGTAGADVINGGAGIDVLTGGNGADTFRVDSKADAGTYAGGDTNANNVMSITDFVVADDTIQLSTTAAAYGAGLDLSTLTTVNVANAVTLQADLADITAFTAAVQTASAATASTDSVLQAIVVTVNAESTTAGDFDSTSAGTYLIINDNATAAWDAADTIINITGVTGTITSADFAIV